VTTPMEYVLSTPTPETATFSIAVEGSPITFPCSGDDVLLRAALRAGVGLFYECNVGSCGSCRVELVHGSVHDLRPGAPGLTARDLRRGNRLLACQTQPRSDCVIRARPQAGPELRPRRFSAELQAALPVTDELREFRFRGPAPATFEPGQYALLNLPGVAGVRAYSLCNRSNGEGEWHFLVKRVPGGSATAYLFDRLQVGDVIELDGPYGGATLRETAERDVVCLAGGSGLAPMLAIARSVAGTPLGSQVQMHFYHGARTPEELRAGDLVTGLDGFGERHRYVPVASDPDAAAAAGWRGAVGHLHEALARDLAPRFGELEFYLAGPPPMITAALNLLVLEHQVPVERIHYDRFF